MKSIIDYLEVWSVNIAAIVAIEQSKISEDVKILAGLVALGYTSWKWYTESEDRKLKKKDGQNNT